MNSHLTISGGATPPPRAPLYDLQAISRTFPFGRTDVQALRDVSLAIRHGEYLALCGASGSGKSTLLNLLGLIDFPTSGTLRLEGDDVAALDEVRRAECRSRKIGFIFQNFNLVPVLSALENVMLPLHIQGQSAAQASARARHWLEQVGLEGQLHFRPDRLSGGQRQRVAIARALITEPRVLLADEPTANLDSRTGDGVMELLASLNRSTGATCIIATHDPRLMERMPRLVRLTDGRIVDDCAREAA
ncbi:ATP-binding cassette domain-containing protein [Duganella sp. FT92W]|uniref:ATP-binding cassette domain-containing protein n=1 Tax=Pseudoduganella rivuli TaxID=2666085 RepID=A0A7X2LXI6_9BURK|nr:ABC transporter ATP-binding protein [Pseudoduganella rivuli]MRV75959.1 ATP-binding cassette domain-containing protein [Pseudoduganella rivuli]